MILSNQAWEKHTVALCAVWSCHQLLRQDHNHRYVTHGGNIFAICTDHIIDKDEQFETFPNRPPDATVRKTASGWDMSELDDFARRLDDDGFVAVGNPKDGTWHEVKPKPIFDDVGNRLETLQPEPVQHFSEEELKSLEPKEFVFTHEVIDGNDFLYQEWLMDVNEGSPHR